MDYWDPRRSVNEYWHNQIKEGHNGIFHVVGEVISGQCYVPEINFGTMRIVRKEPDFLLADKISNHEKQGLDIIITRIWPTDHFALIQSRNLNSFLKEKQWYGEVETMCDGEFDLVAFISSDQIYRNYYLYPDLAKTVAIETYRANALIGIFFTSRKYPEKRRQDIWKKAHKFYINHFRIVGNKRT